MGLLDQLQSVSSSRHFRHWAACALLADIVLTGWILLKVPFTNIDWETYMSQVEGVVGGQFDYAQLRGPTGPVAYPAGFCWVYGCLRWFGVQVIGAQAIFALLYVATISIVFEIYRIAATPSWLVVLCVLSKRVHSIFFLRLFNDSVSQFLAYSAFLLFLKRRRWLGAAVFSAAVSVKMQPVLVCPALGLFLVLSSGWSGALPIIIFMIILQLVLAGPFIITNAQAYFSMAFGGPGDLQHAWSVNWRMLPEVHFAKHTFSLGLLLVQFGLLLGFAHCRWIPGGLASRRIWTWTSNQALDNRAVVCLWFTCNFIGILCMRTLHYQFLVWYYHTIPFLAWYGLQPERHKGFRWAIHCAGVVCLTLSVEASFLFTGQAEVRGPDGRKWVTNGAPTVHGSILLFVTHFILLFLLSKRSVSLIRTDTAKKEA